MTSITPTTPATSSASQTPQAKEPDTSARGNISSDFETFLRMLTTQLENQDPLNPIESSDYAVQLATFSSVEQQVMTNDLLNTLISQSGNGGISQFASWVGMKVRSSAPVDFTGNHVELSFDPVKSGASAAIAVTDESGATVQRIPLAPGLDRMTWDGTDGSGLPAQPGTYSFEIEMYENGSVTDKRPVESFSEVVEVQGGPDGAKLILSGGTSVAPNDVSALRQ